MRPYVDQEADAQCDGCGTKYLAGDLDRIDCPDERLSAGEEVPAGQCPDEECGACCFLVKPEPTGQIWACEECGCTDVEMTAWLHSNTRKEIDGDPPNDNMFCPQCEHDTGCGEVATLLPVDELKPFDDQGICGQCHATGETGTTCRECGRGVFE